MRMTGSARAEQSKVPDTVEAPSRKCQWELRRIGAGCSRMPAIGVSRVEYARLIGSQEMRLGWNPNRESATSR